MDDVDKTGVVGEKPYSQNIAVRVVYAKSRSQLADLLGMSKAHLADHYLTRPDAPKKLKSGYNVQEVAEFITSTKIDRAAKRGGGISAHGDKAEKTRLECELLKVKLDEAVGNSIPRDVFNQKMLALARIVKPVLEKFPRDVMAVTKDAAVIGLAATISTRALEQLSDACAAEGL